MAPRETNAHRPPLDSPQLPHPHLTRHAVVCTQPQPYLGGVQQHAACCTTVRQHSYTSTYLASTLPTAGYNTCHHRNGDKQSSTFAHGRPHELQSTRHAQHHITSPTPEMNSELIAPCHADGAYLLSSCKGGLLKQNLFTLFIGPRFTQAGKGDKGVSTCCLMSS